MSGIFVSLNWKNAAIVLSALSFFAFSETVPFNRVHKDTPVNTNLVGASIGERLVLTNSVLDTARVKWNEIDGKPDIFETNNVATISYVDGKVRALDEDISNRGYITEIDDSKFVRFDIPQTNALSVGSLSTSKDVVIGGSLILTADNGDKYRFGITANGTFYFVRISP